jgi:hypothetical protein
VKIQIIGVVSLILTIIAVGLYLHDQYDNWRVPLAFSVIAAALITFFWFVSWKPSRSSGSASEEGVMRRAITASIVVEYLILVGLFVFWKSDATTLPAITQVFVTNFTAVVGIVIAFYFGTSAYVEAKEKSQSGAIESVGKEQSAQQGAPGDAQKAAHP